MEPFLDSLGLSGAGLAALYAAVFAGALVQGSIGFGLNLIIVPVLAALQPAALPAASIILAFPMTLGSALREKTHINGRGVFWMTLGRLPGVILGAWVVHVFEPEVLSVTIGGIVLIAVLMCLVSPRVEIAPGSQAVAGFVGGLMGTASSIGGPPMGLLYRHEPGPAMRSTLGATFLVGTLLSLAALGFAGEVSTFHWRMGALLVPPVLLGLFASRYLHAWLDAGWLRPAVLGFSALAGVGVVLRGLMAL